MEPRCFPNPSIFIYCSIKNGPGRFQIDRSCQGGNFGLCIFGETSLLFSKNAGMLYSSYFVMCLCKIMCKVCALANETVKIQDYLSNTWSHRDIRHTIGICGSCGNFWCAVCKTKEANVFLATNNCFYPNFNGGIPLFTCTCRCNFHVQMTCKQ